MDKLFTSLLALTSLIAFSNPLPLPPYIKPCKADNTLDKCAIKNGNEGWKKAVKGDPKYRVPVLDPMEIKEMVIDSKSSKQIQLTLTLTDNTVFGLPDMELIDSKMDLKKKHIEWTVKIPKLTLIGSHNIKGKFLLLPIRGSGPANVTIIDVKVKASADYDLQKKKGEEYVKLGKIDLKYTTSRLYARFDNLFNGDKQLSDNMNVVIDENWQELNKEVGPAVTKTLTSILRLLASNILDLVPYKEVFIF